MVLVLLALGLGDAAEPWLDTRLEVDLRLLALAEGNQPNPFPTELPDTLDRQLAGLYLGIGGQVSAGAHVEGTGLVDTQLLTLEDGAVYAGGRPLAEEAKATAFLREARLQVWLPGGLAVRAGKGRFRLGEGLVLDTYGAGLDVGLEAGDFSFQIGMLWPGYDLVPAGSRLTHARAEVHLDLTRRVFVFGTHDAPDATSGGGALRSLVAAAFPRRPELAACVGLRGQSRRLHVGVGADFLLESHWLTAVALLQRGRARIEAHTRSHPTCGVDLPETVLRSVDEPVSGFALDGAWRMRATAKVFPGLFGTWLSGDLEPLEDGWDVYSPPAALLGRTLVFFNAGATTPILDQTLEVAGLQARGVRAAGLTLLYAESAALEVDGVVAFLWPDAGPGHYGREYDLRVRGRLGEAWRIQAEAGVLDEGDFFRSPADWWQVSLVVGWLGSW